MTTERASESDIHPEGGPVINSVVDPGPRHFASEDEEVVAIALRGMDGHPPAFELIRFLLASILPREQQSRVLPPNSFDVEPLKGEEAIRVLELLERDSKSRHQEFGRALLSIERGGLNRLDAAATIDGVKPSVAVAAAMREWTRRTEAILWIEEDDEGNRIPMLSPFWSLRDFGRLDDTLRRAARLLDSLTAAPFHASPAASEGHAVDNLNLSNTARAIIDVLARSPARLTQEAIAAKAHVVGKPGEAVSRRSVQRTLNVLKPLGLLDPPKKGEKVGWSLSPSGRDFAARTSSGQ